MYIGTSGNGLDSRAIGFKGTTYLFTLKMNRTQAASLWMPVHLLSTACATFGLNSHKRYHKYHKYNDFDDRLCYFCAFQAQAVLWFIINLERRSFSVFEGPNCGPLQTQINNYNTECQSIIKTYSYLKVQIMYLRIRHESYSL